MPTIPTAGEPVVTTVMPVAKLPSALRNSRMSMVNAVRSDQVRDEIKDPLFASRGAHCNQNEALRPLIRRSAQSPRAGGPTAHLTRHGRPCHRPSAPGTVRLMLVGLVPLTARRERPSRSLRTRRRGALIQVDDTQHLNPFATLTNFAVDRRPFRRVLQPSLLQRRNMQEHVLRSIRWRNEPVSLFWIEPLNGTTQFRGVIAHGTAGLLSFVHQAHSVFCDVRWLAPAPASDFYPHALYIRGYRGRHTARDNHRYFERGCRKRQACPFNLSHQ